MSWLKRRLFRKKISVSIIGIGNAGCRIGDAIIRNLKESNLNVKSLAVNQIDNFLPRIKNFAETYWFGDKKNTSSNGILEVALASLNLEKEKLHSKLEDVVFYKKGDRRNEEDHALHLIIASGGGTGSAGSIIISKMIAEITGDPPTVIFVVPEKDESSLVQYNTAKALHFLGFDFKGPQSPIILFDNEKLLHRFENENIQEALKKSNEMLAETLTTTILAALQESIHEEYHAGLKEFYTSFSAEARGLGVIVSVDKEFNTLEDAQKVRFSDLFFSEMEESSSLSADVTRAKLGYLTITSPTTYQSTFETRKIVKRFEKGSIRIALNTIDEPYLTIRGILTGIHPDFVDRFWEILEKGRDSRKEIESRERSLKEAYITILRN